MNILLLLHIFILQEASESSKVPDAQDPLKVYVQIGSLIGAIAALLAIAVVIFTKTWPWIRAKLDRRSVEKRMGAELFPSANIERSIRYYVPPFCQDVDPAGGEEPRSLYSVKQKLFHAIDDALTHPAEYRYLILLADSGMGKTSALINYYVRHIRRWRRKFELALIPLGEVDADKRIEAIQNKSNTVLFLDALDEDTLAIIDHRERIRLLLKLTQEFSRVVISCRTQFFNKDEEIPKETGQLKVGTRAAGERAEYIFHKLYLSPLTDKQIRTYVRRRFPIWAPSQRSKAKEIIQKIPNLTVRPMLLAHIDDLVGLKQEVEYSFQLYDRMIEAWLKREEGFISEKDNLYQFSKLLSVDLFKNRIHRGSEHIPRAELTRLAQEWGIPLDDWKLGSRSLLNRDALGNYKFAHRSIMEYLFVRQYLEGDDACCQFQWTDQMDAFLYEMLEYDLARISQGDPSSVINFLHLGAEGIATLGLSVRRTVYVKLDRDLRAGSFIIKTLATLLEMVLKSLNSLDQESIAILRVNGQTIYKNTPILALAKTYGIIRKNIEFPVWIERFLLYEETRISTKKHGVRIMDGNGELSGLLVYLNFRSGMIGPPNIGEQIQVLIKPIIESLGDALSSLNRLDGN